MDGCSKEFPRFFASGPKTVEDFYNGPGAYDEQFYQLGCRFKACCMTDAPSLGPQPAPTVGFATTSPSFVPICEQPKKVGPCFSAIPRWYYDSETDTCTQFGYGGCQGNDNNFRSRVACRISCGGLEPPTPAPTGFSDTPAPTAAFVRPDVCPARVCTSCLTVGDDNPISCVDILIPTDPAMATDDECIVQVQFTYNVTNLGNETRQIYSLTVLRANEFIVVTNLAPEVPKVILEPGESSIAKGGVVEHDLCTEQGIDIFDAHIQVTGAPPAVVDRLIACTTLAGESCEAIVADPSLPDVDCEIPVTYNYTLTNVGETNVNLLVFNQTRGGESMSLLPLLEDSFRIPLGGSISVMEPGLINQCVSPIDTATNLTIRDFPDADKLCLDTYYYPIGQLPEAYD